MTRLNLTSGVSCSSAEKDNNNKRKNKNNRRLKYLVRHRFYSQVGLQNRSRLTIVKASLKLTCNIIFWSIVMFALPVLVYEKIYINLSKQSVFESITFKKQVSIIRQNIAKYVNEWRLNYLHHGNKMANLSQTVFVQSTNEALKWTNTHTHTHSSECIRVTRSHSDECNRRECNVKIRTQANTS